MADSAKTTDGLDDEKAKEMIEKMSEVIPSFNPDLVSFYTKSNIEKINKKSDENLATIDRVLGRAEKLVDKIKKMEKKE